MSLVGSIVERTPDATDATSLTPFPVSADPKTGFPAATHRSQRQRKSAFRQNREAARPLKDGIPIVLSTRPDTELAESTPELTPIETTPETAPDPNWRSTMEADNARRVAEMSTEEREDELRQLGSKFGDLSELADVLRRAKDSKPRSVPTSPTIEEITDEESVPPVHPSAPILPVHNPQHRVASPPRPVLSRRGSITGSSRAPSGLSTPAVRFAEVTPRDVFTYPSAPTSPKRAPLGIEPPSAESGEDVPKVQWKGKLDPTSPPDLKLSTGANLPSTGLKPPGIAFPALSPLDNATPEAIRRQYFPNESANNPSLEWIADLPEIPDTPVTSEYAYLGEKAGEAAMEQRFNLAGTPIPREVGKEMPVHDGLHHNARTSAGYTLGELLHLARSTAPMQRAMALDALARLTARVGKSQLEAWFPRYLPVAHPVKRREGKKRAPDAKGGAGPDTSTGAGPDTAHAGPDTDAAAESDEEDTWFDDKDEDDVDPEAEFASPDRSQVVLPAANLRKIVIESATAALGERGAVGTRAIDVLYAALVLWDHDLPLGNVELTLRFENSNAHIMPSNHLVLLESRESRQNEMNVVDEIPMDVMLGTITRQLAARVLPRSVLGRLLEVLLRLGRQSVSWASAIMETHGLVAEVMRLFVLSGSPYPDSDSSEDQPDVRAIRLLEVLAWSSRQNANKLLDPTDTLLRFVAVLPPVDVPPTLLVATLDLYTTLGRYGLYAHIATTAAASFDALSQYIRTRRDPALTKSWMRLRAVWIACATDPHSTSPPHEILWSQIEGWAWGEDILSFALDDAAPEVWNALVAWLDGAAVNSVRGGAAERGRVVQALKPIFQGGKIRQAIESAVARVGKRQLDGMADDALVLCSALRLDLALLPSGDNPTESPLGLPLDNISKSMDALANNPTWDSFYSWDGTSPYAYSHLTSLVLCLGNYLLLARRLSHLEQPAWLKLAFITLRRLNPSCADIAARLVQEIGVAIADEPSMSHLSKQLAKPSWDALMPFLLHELQPDSEHIVSPLFPSAVSVSHVTTQLLPSRPSLCGKSYGLPAPNDWTLQPLDHLLRSGTSPVFQLLPKEWDSDEVEVVRTLLALTSARQSIVRDSFKIPLTCSEVVFGCMRVFMLEHGQPHDDSSSEIFRDQEVERLMAALLSDVSLGPNPRPKRGGPAQLEVAASRHLAGQPFYQFYTDLVGLYDAVSFAHPLFARVLLPPLSTNYAIDYRRLVWGDYGHILRSIQTEAPDVPDDSIHDWLWPRERDGEMIGWYLKALMKGGVQGFLRFIAVHHVATSLWPEFHRPEDEMSPKDKDRTRMIISALVHQAGPALFGALMLYEQDRWDLVPYPACYEGQGLDRERRAQRLEWAVSLCGDRVRSRIEHVYNG